MQQQALSISGMIIFSKLASCKSVSMCQCVSLPQRPIGSVQVRQHLFWILVAMWRLLYYLFDIFFQIQLPARVCQCVSVSASLRDPWGVCKSDSNCSGSLWLRGGFYIISFIFFFQIQLPARVCQCVSVSASLRDPQGECKSESQTATVLYICGYVEALVSSL